MNSFGLRAGCALELVILSACGKAPIEDAVQKNDRGAVSDAGQYRYDKRLKVFVGASSAVDMPE